VEDGLELLLAVAVVVGRAEVAKGADVEHSDADLDRGVGHAPDSGGSGAARGDRRRSGPCFGSRGDRGRTPGAGSSIGVVATTSRGLLRVWRAALLVSCVRGRPTGGARLCDRSACARIKSIGS